MSELDPRKVDAAAEAALSDAAAVASDTVTADDRAAEAAQQARLQDGADLSAAAAAAAAADEAEGVKPPAEPGGAINGVMPIIFLDDIRVDFKTRTGSLLHPNIVHAVQGLTLRLMPGQTLGIVGESGCGKTTCGRTAIGLYSKTDGVSLYRGEDIHRMRGAKRRAFCCQVQTVFQDPYASLDPKNKVIDLIAEGMDIHHLYTSQAERREKVQALMEQVGLNPSGIDRYPYEFSGGMRQRIGIARALAVEPRLLLCDEPISALDVSIQAQIVNLLLDLREQKALTYLLISHDLSMVRHLSDRILVMYLGEVVEESTAQELYTHPLHPYTKALIAAIPIPDPKVERARPRSVLQGQVPSPVDPPSGCRFAGRCPYATDRCRMEKPALCDMGGGHRVACHLCR